ncbi:transforming growth factor-beta receptor-associated protein 1-like [Saccostrea cucullata]|uniref:transforming growth factor-beta receptor-associated protein 1-like n=1 Tax=Saccostrea cuccullata TaxID=36930 RepID=UPI002ED62033
MFVFVGENILIYKMSKRVAERELTDRNWDQEDDVEEAGTFSVASKAELEKRQIKTAKRSRGSVGGTGGSSAFSGFGGFAFKPTQTSTPFNMNVKSFTNGKTEKPMEDNATKLNGIPEKPEEKKDQNEKEDNSKYMSNLRSLNESVLAWIKQHVEKNPYCILTPIFTDYEKHLKTIENDKSNSSISKSSVKDNGAKSSAPANKDSQPSLSALFKPAAGTWTCDTCMIQNKPDVSKCVACQTSKPGGGASSSQTSSGAPANKDSQPSLSALFKPAAGTWTCDTCMIQNKPDISKCVACQTSKPGGGASPPKTNSTGASDFKFGSNGGFKFGTGTSESSSPNTGIKFGTSESNATTGGFKFESSGTTNTTTSSGFTFGKGDTKSTTSGFSFGKGEEKPASGFTFGKSGTSETSPASGFKFGTGNGSSSVSSGFSFGTNSGTDSAPKTGFSFGSGSSSTTADAGKGFSFAPSTTTASSSFGPGFFSKPTTSTDATGASTTQDDEEYEPPKVESTEVAEEGSLYSVKCKLFYQRDGKWNEKGVGFLHLKKADDKAQLVVRADTNLGNILLNIMLSPSIPLKRQGTNNVYIFCVPNPKINPKDEDNKPVAMLLDCIDVCGKNLYIGTSDCFVVHYTIEERNQTSGKVTFHCDKIGHKYLALKKPIIQIKSASALNRIMVLCDNTISMLNMLDLEPVMGGAKIKGVNCFCFNENPHNSSPFSVEICVALRKKQLQFYTVTEDRFIHLRDVSLSEPAVDLSIDSPFVCVAMSSQYSMINTDTGYEQSLFPYDSENCRPIIKRVGKEEFLLGGPSALGMFVTSDGISQRPPLQWSDNIVSVSYLHPYIIAMNDEFITVHSILDQQQKQTIPFQGGVYLENFDGKVFISSVREIYSLVPVAWEKQVQALLLDKRVTEALDLARNANKSGLSRDKINKIYKRFQQQAAFIEFSQQNFEEALELFKSGETDVREVICLYPKFLPSNSSFTRSALPLHEIADINQLCKGDQNLVKQYKDFLCSYLEEIKGTKLAMGFKQEIDVALLKLYAELNSEGLIPLISNDSGCDLNDCVEWLGKYERYHALGLLYRLHSDHDKALGIWQRLVNGEIQDESFPGLPFAIEYLSNLSDHELVWKYVDWVLTRDPEAGVQIFTSRPSSEPPSERMRPDTIIDYLHRFPEAVISYLEYLIFQKKLEKEKYHTHLAVLYLDSVLQLMKDPNAKKEQIDIARSKLRHMLQMSSLYRVQLILGKAKETDMHAECAILYGKLEEHDKALRILVHKLKDFGAAENYCMVNSSGKDPMVRKRLFHALLNVYLDPSYEQKDKLIKPAVELLNNNVADFDTVKVLQSLPDNWSVHIISQFLSRAVRKSMNLSRNTRIERMMSRGENLRVKQTSIELQREFVTMNDDR